MKFRITIIKLIARLEESRNKNTAPLRAKKRSHQDELKKAMNEMQSKLAALTAMVSEVEKRISDLEDRLMEMKEVEEKRERQ